MSLHCIIKPSSLFTLVNNEENHTNIHSSYSKTAQHYYEESAIFSHTTGDGVMGIKMVGVEEIKGRQWQRVCSSYELFSVIGRVVAEISSWLL